MPKTRPEVDILPCGLGVEAKNNTHEVWEVIKHLETYLRSPMENGVYPVTIPAEGRYERIEINHLLRDVEFGILNVWVFSNDEIFNRVELLLEESVTDRLGLKLKINRNYPSIKGHMQLRYEYTKRQSV